MIIRETNQYSSQLRSSHTNHKSMKMQQKSSAQIITCVLVGLLIPSSQSFSHPRIYHPVRCKDTSCRILPLLKPQIDNVNSNTSMNKDERDPVTKTNRFMSNLKPLMQTELDMMSEEQISKQAKKDFDDSSSSSKIVLFGGTSLILAAAFALGVLMTNDLGIDLEWK